MFPDSEDILIAHCGLLGDLYQHFSDLEEDGGLLEILERGCGSPSSKLRKIAGWASTQRQAG